MLIQERQNERLLHLAGFEAEGAAAALVSDPASGVDHVQPVRHAAVRMADSVVDLIDQKRHAHLQRSAASGCDLCAIGGRLRLRHRHTGFVIRAHPPPVGRMCFANINGQKFSALLVLLVQIFEDPKLGSEGASREAAENDHDGPTAKFIQAVLLLSIMRAKREQRRLLANLRTLAVGPNLAIEQAA